MTLGEKLMAAKGRMQLKIKRDNGKVVMSLNGYLDGSGACQVEHALRRLKKIPKDSKLIFDLGRVRNFEYFGIAILAKSIRNQRKCFQEISLTGLPPSTENVFKRFGLENGKVTRAPL
jgi:anti-anti-sigma factor